MDKDMVAPETKADLSQAFSEFMGAFEAFRETNDRRLAEIERKASADVVTADKLARVEAALDAQQRRMDEMVLKGRRPSLTGGETGFASETKSAFDRYVRSGDASGLVETKALSGTPAEAGFTVPPEIEATVMRRLSHVSPFRAICGVREVSSGTYKKPVTSGAPVTGWVGAGTVTDTDAPVLHDLSFTAMELYAMPAATSSQLEDSAVDLEQWLADEIETVFAEQETAAFVTGDGTSTPQGFLAYPTVDEGSWSWGSIGVLKTGVDGAFPPGSPADRLIDVIYALKAGYRQNATFVMNRKTQAAVRKMKSDDGQYLWAPPTIPGGRASLFNFPVVEAEDMPDMDAAAAPHAIAFGDFRRGYLIVDRQGLRILRDPYSQKPYVLFYTTKRVGGGVQDFDAIKLLSFEA